MEEKKEVKTKGQNPFTLTFGKQPKTYVSRIQATADRIIEAFEVENPISQTCLISGARGSGKSALLAAVTNKLSKSKDWVIVELNSKQPLSSEFVTRLIDNGLLKMHFFTILYVAFMEHYGMNYSDKDSVGRMNLVMNSLTKNHKKVLVTVDDAVVDENMRIFMSQFQLMVRKNFNIYLVMTGLPENISGSEPSLNLSFLPKSSSVVFNANDISQMQKVADSSFLLRMPKLELEPLNIEEIKKEYQRIFDISEEEALKLANLTMGYPFAFQALGLLYWDYRDTCTYEQIVKKLDALLEDFVYRAIWGETTEPEKDILFEMPIEGQKISISELFEKVQMKQDDFIKYTERLINRGLCAVPEKGYLTIILPRLRSIIKTYEDASSSLEQRF